VVRIYPCFCISCFCSQVTETEPKNSSADAVQLTANNEEANNSPSAADRDGHGECDNQTVQHLASIQLMNLCHDVNSSSVTANTSEVLTLEVDAAQKDVLDYCQQTDGSEINVDDNTKFVNMKSVESSQGKLSGSDHKLESCCDAGMKSDEVLCLPTSENANVNENCVVAVNSRDTSPHTSEGPCQDLCSHLSPKDLPNVELQSLGSRDVTEAEAKYFVDKNCSAETPVNDDLGVLVDKGSERMAESPSDAGVMFTVDAQNSPIQFQTICRTSRSLESTGLLKAEAKYVVNKNYSAETMVSDDRGVLVDRSSGKVAESQSGTFVTSEGPVQQDSITKTGGCVLSSPENPTIEISTVKTQCCQTEECLVNAGMLMVDAQNSPIEFCSSSSIGCSPLQLPTSVADMSKTVECWVQTSPCVVDGSCSPLRNVMTCSTGCSPFEVQTRSARTSPVFFLPTVGCSMRTELWMTDAQCSPIFVPHCEASPLANAQTSLHQCSAKPSTASFSTYKPQSQTTAGSTTPNIQQNNPLRASGELFCRKLSSVASAVRSQSSYATLISVACSDEDPQQVHVTDDQKSFEDSTQPLSCEELFDDESPLSYRSASKVAHQLCSMYPSPLAHTQASTLKTRNISNDNQLADSEDHGAEKVLNSGDSYSLESSQILPKCSDKESNEEAKSDHANSVDETDIQHQFN